MHCQRNVAVLFGQGIEPLGNPGGGQKRCKDTRYQQGSQEMGDPNQVFSRIHDKLAFGRVIGFHTVHTDRRRPRDIYFTANTGFLPDFFDRQPAKFFSG